MSGEAKYMMVPYKSSFAALVLSLLLGPLGVLYASWKISLVLVVIFLLNMLSGINIAFTAPVAALIWLVSIYLSVIFVGRYNQSLFKAQKVAA